MGRKFVYRVPPDEVKEYLTGLGYKLEDRYSRDGKFVTGFRMYDTNVELNYDIGGRHSVTGDLITLSYGTIALNTNPFSPHYIPEKAEESRKLYEKLYRTFRKPSR